MLTKNLISKIFSPAILSLILTASAVRAGDAERIKFARGENSASVAGSVAAGETDRFLVGGREGQKMSVKISSGEKNAVFQIKDAASGRFVGGAGEADEATEWSDSLPTTGDYEIVIGATRGSADYKLSVAVK